MQSTRQESKSQLSAIYDRATGSRLTIPVVSLLAVDHSFVVTAFRRALGNFNARDQQSQLQINVKVYAGGDKQVILTFVRQALSSDFYRSWVRTAVIIAAIQSTGAAFKKI